MSPKTQNQPSLDQIINSILDTGHLNRQEYVQLVNYFLSDFLSNEHTRHQINQIFDELQLGRLKFID